MKICLIGHRGFIGKNLLDRLQVGHEIISLEFRLDDRACMTRFFLHHADFDLIIHAAGAVLGDAHSIMHTNLWGTFLLVESLKSQKKPFSIVFFSSGAVYGDVAADHSSSETDTLAPVDFYGLSKKSAEDLLRVASAIQGFGLIVFRLPSTYGPCNVKGVLFSMIADAQRSGEIKIFGEGSEIRSFVDVRDVASVVLHIIGTSWRGTMNISSDESFTTEALAHLIQKYISAKITYQPGNNRLKRMVLDNSLMKMVTGLQPKFSLEGFLRSLP